MDKVEDPLQTGIQTYWVVNPQRKSVTIYGHGPFSESFVGGPITNPITGITANLESVFS